MDPALEAERDACARLWAACLARLVADAVAHRTGEKVTNEQPIVLEAAERDVLECGPMLRRCCQMTGDDPEWIGERYRAWIKAGCPVPPRRGRRAR